MLFIHRQYSPTERSPLHEGAEGGVELEGAVLGIAEELPLERHPGLPRGASVGPD